MKKFIVELNEKELYLLWSIAAWFRKSGITSSLMHKLSGMCDGDDRRKYDAQYEKRIYREMIHNGKFLDKEAEIGRLEL